MRFSHRFFCHFVILRGPHTAAAQGVTWVCKELKNTDPLSDSAFITSALYPNQSAGFGEYKQGSDWF